MTQIQMRNGKFEDINRDHFFLADPKTGEPVKVQVVNTMNGGVFDAEELIKMMLIGIDVLTTGGKIYYELSRKYKKVLMARKSN